MHTSDACSNSTAKNLAAIVNTPLQQKNCRGVNEYNHTVRTCIISQPSTGTMGDQRLLALFDKGRKAKVDRLERGEAG